MAALGCSLKEATVDCSVDIMSFGGTKNGLLIGEAILIFNKNYGKMRRICTSNPHSFSPKTDLLLFGSTLLENELWRKNGTSFQ